MKTKTVKIGIGILVFGFLMVGGQSYSQVRGVAEQTLDGYLGQFYVQRSSCLPNNVPVDRLGSVTVGHQEGTPRPFCFGYNPAGKIAAQVDPLGFLTSMQFDSLERMTQSVTPMMSISDIVYDGRSQAASMTQNVTGKAAGSSIPDVINGSMRYDGVGNFIGSTVENIASNVNRTGDGRPTVLVGPGGTQGKCYEYNELGFIKAVRQGPVAQNSCQNAPIVQTYEYDSSGRLSIIRNALNHIIEAYEYDGFDRVQRISYADGSSTSKRYLSNRDLVDRVQKLDDEGTVLAEMQYKYDGLNRVTEIKRITIAQGGLFDQALQIMMRALGLGQGDPTTTFQYQQNGLVTVVTQKPGPKVGNGARQLVTEIIRNKFGQLENVLSRDNPRSTDLRYFYNARGELERVEDRIRGTTTTYAYNPEGRLASVTNPLGQVATMRADSLGNPVQVAAPNGTTVEQVHNIMGLLEQVRQGPAGGAMTAQMTMSYDPANFRLNTIQGASGSAATAGYEAGTGRLSSFTGPGNVGRTVQILAWDEMSRPTRTQDALGTTWEYSYDSMGRIRLMSGQSSDNRWPKFWRRYRHNYLGQIQDVMETIGQSPDELWAENVPSLDKGFSLISEARAQLERAEDQAQPAGGQQQQQDQSCPALPQVVDAIGPSPNILSAVFFDYDGLGRVKKEERIIAADDSSYHPVKTYYDGADNIVRTEMPHNMILDFDFDQSNRIKNISLKEGGTEKGKASYNYADIAQNRFRVNMNYRRNMNFPRIDQLNPLGKLRERTYSGIDLGGAARRGLWQETRKFNNANQLGASRHWARVVLTGNRNFDVTEVRRHSYDDFGRLSGWHWIENADFTNLPFESLPQASNTPATWGFAYNNQSHLTRDDDFFNVATEQTYDAVGGISRLQKHNGCHWGSDDSLDCAGERQDDTYDFHVIGNNWVIEIDKNNQMKHYIMYDVFGRPAYFTDAERNLEVAYVYDGFNRLIKEFVIENCALTREREYIWSGERLMQIMDDPADDRPTITTFFYEGNSLVPSGEYRKKGNDGKMFYYLMQADGSVAAVLDKDSGEIVEYYMYTPYGQLSQVTDAAGAQTASARKTRFMFKGQLVSPESGWYLARGRIYAPELKQFLQTAGSVSHLGFANFGLKGGDPMN